MNASRCDIIHMIHKLYREIVTLHLNLKAKNNNNDSSWGGRIRVADDDGWGYEDDVGGIYRWDSGMR